MTAAKRLAPIRLANAPHWLVLWIGQLLEWLRTPLSSASISDRKLCLVKFIVIRRLRAWISQRMLPVWLTSLTRKYRSRQTACGRSSIGRCGSSLMLGLNR